MGNSEEDVIDLTKSFISVGNANTSNEVIVIDYDESYCVTVESSSKPSRKRKTTNLKTPISHSKASIKSPVTKNSKKIGECPICWDELGKSPLASTKCGHVYCLKCLERSLKTEKKCPSCRKVLKGSSAYHPLYLNLQ